MRWIGSVVALLVLIEVSGLAAGSFASLVSPITMAFIAVFTIGVLMAGYGPGFIGLLLGAMRGALTPERQGTARLAALDAGRSLVGSSWVFLWVGIGPPRAGGITITTTAR
jgi:hypothetical protein